MITTLAIKNYALIEDIRVDLKEGLTIITGETGAGKSILLGALSLLLGKRAELRSVKDSTKKCVIEGEFSIEGYNLEEVFKKNDLDYDVHTIIRREILPGGKSRAFVNDTPVSLVQLQALGLYLVDVHSQQETLTLASEIFQMEVIDALAGNTSILEKYGKRLGNFNTISETIAVLNESKEKASKELDYNTFLHKELEEARLKELNQESLEETFETLNNSEAIQESLSKMVQLFSEEQIGALETTKEARIVLGKLKGFTGIYESLWNRLNSVVIELEDIVEEVEGLTSSIEADPKRLLEVNERLQVLYRLQQKHTVLSVDELLDIQENLLTKIDSTASLDDRIVAMEKEQLKERETTLVLAKELHNKRIKVIPKLKEALEAYLGDLGLPNAQFQFDIEASEVFRKNGTDTLQLLFTANKGLAFGPLKKIASGGEMSRIMLAVKAVLARYKKLPTIIFDEIDTGVSGEIANKMAHIMGAMSQKMQLLSITHLPQIAAKGEHHIKVYKEDVNEVTQTRLRNLNDNERVVEIAQMIGGNKVTDAAIANAKELLN